MKVSTPRNEKFVSEVYSEYKHWRAERSVCKHGKKITLKRLRQKNCSQTRKTHGQRYSAQKEVARPDSFGEALAQRDSEKYKRDTETYRQVARTNRPSKILTHISVCVCKQVKALSHSKKTKELFWAS